MSVIVEFTVPADDFEFGSALQDEADTRIELDRAVPTAGTIIPFFWMYGADDDRFRDRLAANENVASVKLLDRLADGTLFRVEWVAGIDGLIGNIVEHRGHVVEATGTATQWAFELRFQTTEDVSSFQAGCRESGVSLDIIRVHELERSGANPRRLGLTAAQREVLVLASEGGYFAIPRRTTLVEIGEELGISDQAVSERLRRAQTKLVEAAITADRSEDHGSDSGDTLA